MDPAENYRALARYNTWMNRRIYAVCLRMSDEERTRDVGAFFKSIHGTLNHLLMGDHAWLLRCTGDVQRFSPRDGRGEIIALRGYGHVLYEDFTEMAARREIADQMIEDWTSSLTADTLGRNVQYRGLRGGYDHPLWWCATHLFNHQAHHRGQLTTVMTQLGYEPGVTDFIEQVRGTSELPGN
jgi:uncharacterized damage-inducible protein DinB